MAKNEKLEALLRQINELNLSQDETKDAGKRLAAIARDKKAAAKKAKQAAFYGPLFDAIDGTLASNPKIAAMFNEQKDTIRITVKGSAVDRQNFRLYKSRAGDGSTNGGRNGTTVWHRVTRDGEHKGKVVEFTSIRALCNFYDVVDNGASGRVDAKKHEIDFLEVRPEGDVVTFSA